MEKNPDDQRTNFIPKFLPLKTIYTYTNILKSVLK